MLGPAVAVAQTSSTATRPRPWPARETRDGAALGWEVARLVGLERAMGQVTFHATFDPAFLLDLASCCGVSAEDRGSATWSATSNRCADRTDSGSIRPTRSCPAGSTFDLARSLRRLGDGDWVGNEEPATFTPYRRGPRRH